jgi:hypothetical protein
VLKVPEDPKEILVFRVLKEDKVLRVIEDLKEILEHKVLKVP